MFLFTGKYYWVSENYILGNKEKQNKPFVSVYKFIKTENNAT